MGLNLCHEYSTALENALALPRAYEILAFNADRAGGGTANDGTNVQFGYHLAQQRHPEFVDGGFCGWRCEMQRAHILSGDVVHVKPGKQVDEAAVPWRLRAAAATLDDRGPPAGVTPAGAGTTSSAASRSMSPPATTVTTIATRPGASGASSSIT
jgi:hypothetical protein